MAEPMLKIDNIDVYYGAIHALKGISLEVNEGEIVTLIGANGAGKSWGRASPVSAPMRSSRRASRRCRKAAASSRR